MNHVPHPSPPPVPAAPSAASPGAAPKPSALRPWGAGAWAAVAGVVLAVVALGVAWNTQQRVRVLERQLVQRQQDTQGNAAAARELARAADDVAREAAARVALLEAKVTELAQQRVQIEDLIQTLSRSQDENVLNDLAAALRVSMQHTAITGSAEPLVATLRQGEERLARLPHPGLERVRRAIARDLERVTAVAVPDIATLALRLDAAMRQVDELPLLAAAQGPGERRGVRERAAARSGPAGSRTAAPPPAAAASPAAGASEPAPEWSQPIVRAWETLSARAWDEVRSLVRVTRIDTPEAVLVAPEQAYFLRENVKLRLLDARLALLARQFDIAQADLRDVQAALQRYFDRGSRRVEDTAQLVRQVMVQARQVSVPRPDETLAALEAASR